jgi:hypothetical protein
MLKMVSITFLGLLTVSAVHAQSGRSVKATIPFDFTVRNTTLEAGTYRLTYSTVSNVLLVQSLGKDGESVKVVALPSLAPHATSSEGKLVFLRVGDDRSLARVWAGAGENGPELQVPQANSKNSAALASQSTLITITAE